MWAIFVFGLVLGAACGLARLKVWLLVPGTFLIAIVAVVVGSMLRFEWAMIALTVTAGAAFFQFSYLVGGILSELPSFHANRASSRSVRAHLFYAMQSAIGEELRIYYQVTRDLPWEFRTKVDQLQAQLG